MMNSIWLRYLLVFLACFPLLNAEAAIYKNIDANGKVTYSDQPLSTTSQALKSVVVQTSTSNPPVKWHPGHYLLVYPQGKDTSDAEYAAYMNSVIQEVAANPAYQGIQKQYFWNKLEPAKGSYDLTEIKKDLTALAAVKKRLVIAFEERSFNNGEIYAPQYLRTSEYSGGVYPYNGGKGYNVNYWNDKVQARLLALAGVMGKQLNSEPYLEAIVLEETAHSNFDSNWVKSYSTKYYSGVINFALAMKAAFPNTVVIQYINYADWNLPRIVTSLVAGGVGVGGPDVSEKDKGLLGSSYVTIAGLSNQVPIGMAVQYLNYDFNDGVGPKNPPSIASIHNFAQNQLKANYIFWQRRTKEPWNGSNYYQNVLDHLRTINWTLTPKGGLDTRCPILLKVCNTN